MLVMIVMILGCDGEPDTPTTTPTPVLPPNPIEPITITIGYIGNFSGANVVNYESIALREVANHYNTNGIIPYVMFEYVIYDDQWDLSRVIPGYNNLREKGADLIITEVTYSSIVLKPHVAIDETLVFTNGVEHDAFSPPGYVFGFGTLAQYEIYTLLSWIAENDWDWETKGPAKIGATMWGDPYSEGLINGLKEYCAKHSEQYELVDTFLTDIKFSWNREIEAFRDCDYVLPPFGPLTFIQEYRESRATAKFIGTNSHFSQREIIERKGLWGEIDEMLIIRSHPSLIEEGDFNTWPGPTKTDTPLR